MKKLFAGLMAAILVTGTLAGCNNAKTAKTGFAFVSSTAERDQQEPGEEEGLVQLTAVVAAALVDEDGKVIKMQTDTVQTKFNYTADGTVTTENNKVYPSKNDLGAEYGMQGASAAAGIGKEWFEQNEAFEEYVVGKTAQEIRDIAVTDGKATDEDLASGVTITITPMIEAAAKAVENATDIGAGSEDELGLNVLSKAQVGEGGALTAYNHYGVVTLNADGEITSSIIDASQQKAQIEGGVQTADVTAPVESKMILKDDYGMKGASEASGIGKEWYEQSLAFSEFIQGKTVADVNGIGLEEGRPTGDLASGVTVHANDWIAVVDAAAKATK